MTRINCIPVQYLTDEHLRAEYREITRISKLARVLDDYGYYKMGAGHVKFFYNKGLYLFHRTEELYQECRERGFNVIHKVYQLSDNDDLNGWWEPDHVDVRVNVGRLQERVAANPKTYHYMGDRLIYMFNDWRRFYQAVREENYAII